MGATHCMSWPVKCIYKIVSLIWMWHYWNNQTKIITYFWIFVCSINICIRDKCVFCVKRSEPLNHTITGHFFTVAPKWSCLDWNEEIYNKFVCLHSQSIVRWLSTVSIIEQRAMLSSGDNACTAIDKAVNTVHWINQMDAISSNGNSNLLRLNAGLKCKKVPPLKINHINTNEIPVF